MSGPLIKATPCERCAQNRQDVGTGAWYCAASPSGDYECTAMVAVEELLEKALASAEHWQHNVRHTPAEARHEAIEAEAGVYCDWAASLGAEFDADAWIARCGEVKVQVAA